MKDNVENKKLILFMLIAYGFSVLVRYYWVYWASGIDDFVWNGTVMINNVDGYYYAAGAKEILNHSHIVGDLNPYNSLPSIITAFVAKITPFSLDQVILWLPAVFGSLVVIPLILIGRTLKNDFLGFFAALIGSIAWSYYNRTMAGYYDTDMLVIVLLMFVFWGMIEFFVNKNEKMFLIVPLLIIFYESWYPQSRAVLLSILAISFIYAFVFSRDRKTFLFLIIAMLSLSQFPYYVNLIAVFGLYFLLKRKEELFESNKNIVILFAISFLLVALSGTFNGIINSFVGYFFRKGVEANNLHYFSVTKTVREASHIPYDLVAKRVSGAVWLFVLSAIGYIFMLIRYPTLLISLPSVIIGLMAFKLGLRFTIYAVPFFALGFSYLSLWLGENIANFIKADSKKLKPILALLFVATSLYANIKHIIGYKVPTTFNKQEVESLIKLSKIASKEDYVLTWWDYGYPIRYYAETKTLIDGGKHTGEVNFPVSFALTHNQIAAANIARLDTEYSENLERARELNKSFKTEGFIPDMMKRYGFKDVNEFLDSLSNPDFKLPKKSRDIYFFLPYRMMDIFPTVAIFSSIDLNTGHKIKNNFFYKSNSFVDRGDFILLGRGIQIDKKNGVIYLGNRKIPIKRFSISFLTKDGKTLSQTQIVHQNGYLNVIFMKSYNAILVLDDDMYNSTYIQLFALGNYDKNLFELVESNPWVKIYRLKL